MLEQLVSRLRNNCPVPADEQALPDAAVLVALTRETEPELILTRRALTMNSHAGEVAFPGGKRDLSDASLLHTALRESEEEVGLEPSCVEVLGALPQVRSRAGIRVTPWVGLVDPAVRLVPNPAELDSIFRVPLRFFVETRPVNDHLVRWMGNEFLMPTWRHGDQVIWGLTAYIIVDLVNMAFDAGLEMPTPAMQRSAV
jgi:8-oxo-dGTP pyrophosphatase MutT (NUDIX family)